MKVTNTECALAGAVREDRSDGEAGKFLSCGAAAATLRRVCRVVSRADQNVSALEVRRRLELRTGALSFCR